MDERRSTEATRRALETEALRLVGRNGLAATTVAQIAEAAGVTERTFFRYFASKQDVVLGYVAERLGEVVAAVGMRCSEEVDLPCLIGVFRTQAAALARDEEFVRRMRIINDDRRLREQLHVERMRFQEHLSAEIGRLRGGSKPDLYSDVLASVTIAIVSTGADVWLDDPGSRPVEGLIDDAADMVLGP